MNRDVSRSRETMEASAIALSLDWRHWIMAGAMPLALAGLVLTAGAPAAAMGGEIAAENVTATNMVRQTGASGTNHFMGKLGLGTNSPAYKLQVAGDASVSGDTKANSFTVNGLTTTNWNTEFWSGVPLVEAFWSNGVAIYPIPAQSTNYLRIPESFHAGTTIGEMFGRGAAHELTAGTDTTNSDSISRYDGAAYESPIFYCSTSTWVRSPAIAVDDVAVFKPNDIALVLSRQVSNQVLRIRALAPSNEVFQALTVLNNVVVTNCSLGIGTNAPSVRLHVVGDSILSGTSTLRRVARQGDISMGSYSNYP